MLTLFYSPLFSAVKVSSRVGRWENKPSEVIANNTFKTNIYYTFAYNTIKYNTYEYIISF
ncbi:MAG: hypothetical protein K0B08_09065 [Bacteroidales bacterium]|nr:hypothetical protein [Bacteroidales bacterium]